MCVLYGNYIDLFKCAPNLGYREFKLCLESVHRGDVSCGSGT